MHLFTSLTQLTVTLKASFLDFHPHICLHCCARKKIVVTPSADCSRVKHTEAALRRTEWKKIQTANVFVCHRSWTLPRTEIESFHGAGSRARGPILSSQTQGGRVFLTAGRRPTGSRAVQNACHHTVLLKLWNRTPASSSLLTAQLHSASSFKLSLLSHTRNQSFVAYFWFKPWILEGQKVLINFL